jgi:hypothetical protein
MWPQLAVDEGMSCCTQIIYLNITAEDKHNLQGTVQGDLERLEASGLQWITAFMLSVLGLTRTGLPLYVFIGSQYISSSRIRFRSRRLG